MYLSCFKADVAMQKVKLKTLTYFRILRDTFIRVIKFDNMEIV